MLYLGIGEIVTQDFTHFLKKGQKIGEERKNCPNKYPNRLNLEDGRLAEFFLGKKGMMRNFIIYETEDPQQFLNLQTFWLPEIQYTFIPIFHVTDIKKSWEEKWGST
jgi:hypothetical protein